MNRQLYLLTGAAGNLGSSISRTLIEQGKNVRCLVLKGDPAENRVPKEAEVFIGDVTDNDSLEKFFTVPSSTEIIVIHAASIVTVSPDYSQKVYNVNVTGTQNIIDKCVDHKVKKLVYISSTGAIPELPKGKKISEVSTFDPEKVIGFYGKTKAEATQLVLNAVKERGLDASVVFPSGISGPNDYGNGYMTNVILDIANGKMTAGIEGSFNAVDVRDLANGVIACTEKGRKGEGYIMSNCTVSLREFCDLVSENTGAPKLKTILPVPMAKLLAGIMWVTSKFTGKSGLLTNFAIYNLARNNEFTSEKAKRELGYSTRPFNDTIRDMVIWLREEGRIAPPFPNTAVA